MKNETLTPDELAEELERHKNLYYAGQPEVSDVEYDNLEDRLREHNPNHTFLKKVGANIGFGDKVRHERPMQSLDKTRNIAEVVDKFGPDTQVQFKYDGLAVSIKYVRGVPVLALTRGNGKVGENVTANVLQIGNVPKIIKRVGVDFEVRGEVVCKRSVFGGMGSRNWAVGSLRQKNPAITKERNLDFVAFEVICEDYTFEKYTHSLNFLKRYGFTVPHTDVCDNWDLFEEIRNQIDYDTDGLVFKSNNYEDHLNLEGSTPSWALAYKFQSEERIAVLEKVSWNKGRTGRVTPVANFSTVDFNGAKVRRASLHSLKNLKDLNLNIGDQIVVSRRNDVIPYVEKVHRHTGAIPIMLPPMTTVIGAHLYKSNVGNAKKDLWHALCTMGLDGFGPKSFNKLWDVGILQSVSDLWSYDRRLASLVIGPAFEQRLQDTIQRNKRMTVTKILAMLNIEALGPVTARALAGFGRTLGEISSLSEFQISGIKGIGAITANKIHAGLEKKRGTIYVICSNVFIDGEEPAEGNARTICFTGKVEGYTRAQLHKLAEQNGYRSVSSVNKDLDVLVVSGSRMTNKIKTAQRLGTEIKTPEDFFRSVTR